MIIQSKPEHEIAYQDLCALITKHAGKLTPQEILAVAGNMVGKLIAMQDQRTLTPAMAMEIVANNIEAGNQDVLRQLANESSGNA